MRSPAGLLVRIAIVAAVAALAQFAPGPGVPDWLPWGSREPAAPAPAAFVLPPGPRLTGPARVLDGDSLALAGEQIRLFGIDAPEGRQACRDGAGRRYACGRVAARALAAATAGRTVACTRLERDRYDRQVALCAADGRDLGEAMVRAGLAVELPEYSQGRYTAAEHEARAARRGLWAGTFERPAEWRRGRGR
jgi:endonuclease YncB( thermonuclease family)